MNPLTGGFLIRAVPFKGDTTLFEIWAAIGSPSTSLDDDAHVKVIRPDPRHPVVKVINIREMLVCGYSGGNIRIKPNDIVYVPPTFWGKVNQLTAAIVAPFTGLFTAVNTIRGATYFGQVITGRAGPQAARSCSIPAGPWDTSREASRERLEASKTVNAELITQREEQTGPGLSDYVNVIRRRIWQVLIPFLGLGAAELGVAFLIPKEYGDDRVRGHRSRGRRRERVHPGRVRRSPQAPAHRRSCRTSANWNS